MNAASRATEPLAPAEHADPGPGLAKPAHDVVQARRLGTFLNTMITILFLFVPVDVAYGWYFRDATSFAMATTILGVAGLLLWARQRLRRGHLYEAVAIVSGSIAVASIGFSLLRPWLYPVLAVGNLLAVAIALPFLPPKSLRRVMVGAWAATAFVVVQGQFIQWSPPGSIPTAASAAINSAAFIAVVGLVFLMLWFFGRRLRDTLDETRKAHANLHVAHDQLQQLDRMKTRFMNTTAHELSTPLTPIRIQLHLLQGPLAANLPPEVRNALLMINRNFERLGHLVADLLDTTRVEAGKLVLQPGPVDLNRVVQETVKSFQPTANELGIRLASQTDDALQLVGDERRLVQVLFNLLSNALKFTPRGGRVALHARRVGTDAVISVEDDGVGIASNDLPRLFQAFSQAHSVPNASQGGTGLGLFIAKGIIEGHGGRIWAHSAGPGKGSTFFVQLPIQAAIPTHAAAGPHVAAFELGGAAA